MCTDIDKMSEYLTKEIFCRSLRRRCAIWELGYKFAKKLSILTTHFLCFQLPNMILNFDMCMVLHFFTTKGKQIVKFESAKTLFQQ